MRRTRSSLLLGIVFAVSAIALAACCKDKTEEPTEATPTPETSAAAAADAAAPVLDTPDPDWKTKCPDADRPESGTVTALRALQIFKKPDSTSEKVSNIGPGTWVNLLGAKGTWYCIDYPCGVGQLCPGWIEARYSKRKDPELDAGVDAGKDAGDGGRGRLRLPNLRLKDGGTTAPPATNTGGTTKPPPRPPAGKVPPPGG